MADRSQSLMLIQKSGVVNTKMTLGEILEISSQLERLNPGSLAAWTFISPNYVYTGDDKIQDIGQVVSHK